jgi:hypothetical protein
MVLLTRFELLDDEAALFPADLVEVAQEETQLL